MTKILDCTLRDGGYYTNWDFKSETVDAYIQAMNVLPIDYLEFGYLNNSTKEYIGKFGCKPPISTSCLLTDSECFCIRFIKSSKNGKQRVF